MLQLLEFDQVEFFVDLPTAVSMDSVGYVYVPTACQSGKKTCRLHLAFHGCLQGRYVRISSMSSVINAIDCLYNIILRFVQSICLQ